MKIKLQYQKNNPIGRLVNGVIDKDATYGKVVFFSKYSSILNKLEEEKYYNIEGDLIEKDKVAFFIPKKFEKIDEKIYFKKGFEKKFISSLGDIKYSFFSVYYSDIHRMMKSTPTVDEVLEKALSLKIENMKELINFIEEEKKEIIEKRYQKIIKTKLYNIISNLPRYYVIPNSYKKYYIPIESTSGTGIGMDCPDSDNWGYNKLKISIPEYDNIKYSALNEYFDLNITDSNQKIKTKFKFINDSYLTKEKYDEVIKKIEKEHPALILNADSGVQKKDLRKYVFITTSKISKNLSCEEVERRLYDSKTAEYVEGGIMFCSGIKGNETKLVPIERRKELDFIENFFKSEKEFEELIVD